MMQRQLPSDKSGDGAERHPPWVRRALPRLLWGLGFAALLVLLIADPLHLHPVDSWLHSLLKHEQVEGGKAPAEVELWTCPMHPEILRKEPGQCPICNMDLVPVRDTGVAAGGEPSAPEGKTLWTCGMHPQVVQEEPGQCPICHMDLTPLRSETTATQGGGEHDEHQGAVVSIDPVVAQNMNVVVDTVRARDLHRSIRTVGYLDYDHEKMVTVTTKFTGYVEKVHVIYLGQPVRKGDPLFEVYSPELVQTQQELLSALDYARRMAAAPEDSRRRAQALVEASRARLAYWDISSEQVARLEAGGEVQRRLAVVAASDGVVMKRMEGLDGMAIKPGMEVMHIADLGTLWLRVEVFENQLPWVDTGSRANVRLAYFPGESFTGKVRFVEPQVTEKTRTVGLTLEMPNAGGRLRAGMYATVEFEPMIVRDAVAVPSQALIRTGDRNVVVVALGGGRFAPREVELGREGDGYVQVLSNLEAGERIVTSAQFLIDSESNLRAAIQKMIAGHVH